MYLIRVSCFRSDWGEYERANRGRETIGREDSVLDNLPAGRAEAALQGARSQRGGYPLARDGRIGQGPRIGT